METKVAVLESRIANLEILLKEMRNQAADNQEKINSLLKENQEKIISLLSLSKEKSQAEPLRNESVSTKQENSELNDDALDESVKKVELPIVRANSTKSEKKTKEPGEEGWNEGTEEDLKFGKIEVFAKSSKTEERRETKNLKKERDEIHGSSGVPWNAIVKPEGDEKSSETMAAASPSNELGEISLSRETEECDRDEDVSEETTLKDSLCVSHNLRNQAVSFTIEGCHTQSGDEEETQPEEAPPEALPEEPPPKEGDDGTTVDAVGLDCDGGVPLLSLALIFSDRECEEKMDRECEEKMTVSTDCFPGNVDSVSLVLGQADPFEIKKEVFQEKRGATFPVGLLPSITNTHMFSHVYLEHFSTTRQRCFTVDTFQGLVMSLISDPSLSLTHLKAVYIEISSFGKYVECTEKGETTLAIKRVEEPSPATFFWVVKYTNQRCYINGLQLLFKGEGKQIKLLVGVSRRYSNGFGQLINISILVMHPLVHKWNTGGTQQDRSIMGSATTCHGNQTPHNQHSTPINNEERCLKIESDRENKKLHPSANEFLIWKQCIGGEIGVAKGNHCLHAEIVSSVYSNHINLETLLLQHPMEKQGWVIKNVVATTIYGTQTTLPDIRGLLNALPQLSRSGGIFAAYIMNVNEAQFPSLSLEDKAGFHGAGSDRHLLLLSTRRVNSSLLRRIRILIEGEIGRKNNIIFRK